MVIYSPKHFISDANDVLCGASGFCIRIHYEELRKNVNNLIFNQTFVKRLDEHEYLEINVHSLMQSLHLNQTFYAAHIFTHT